MVGLKYLVAITKREFAQDYLDFFKRHGIKNVLSNFCNGTASEGMLDLMGLEKTEKVMFKTIVNAEKVPIIMKGLLSEMDISASGVTTNMTETTATIRQKTAEVSIYLIFFISAVPP